MNSVYPASHFGYQSSGATAVGPPAGGGGPGVGGAGGAGGFATMSRPMSDSATMMCAAAGGVSAAGGRMMDMSMVSRLTATNTAAAAAAAATAAASRTCAGCGGRIMERVLLHSMDRFWHEACLKCTCCAAPLADSQSCFIKSGMILCRNDYLRMFGSCGQCAACGQNIPPSELVMRIGGTGTGGAASSTAAGLVYHLRCFTCSKCSQALSRGDRYLLVNGAPVCEQDAHKLHLATGGAGVAATAVAPPSGLTAAPTASAVKKTKVGRPRRQRE